MDMGIGMDMYLCMCLLYVGGKEAGTTYFERVEVKLPHEALEASVPEVLGQDISLQQLRVGHLEGASV